MANTFKFGNGNWAVKDGYALAYNDENNNFKPLPFDFTRASSATRVNRQGLVETVGSGKPRIDFTDNTSGHLLLEPSRTNRILYSEDFSNASWLKFDSVSVTINDSISPDGNNTATTLSNATGTSRNSNVLQFNASGLSSSTAYTFSVYVKSTNTTNVQLGLFDASTGVNNNQDFTVTSSWQRISFTATTGSSTTFFNAYIGDTSGDISIWGAQVEAGSYATSYIPTEGSTVTRVAETANGAGNSTVFNDSEGVLYAEFSALANDSTTRVITINDTSNQLTERVQLFILGTSMYGRVTDGGVTQGEVSSTPTLTDNNKIAFKYKANDFALWINGVEVDTSSSGSTPSGLDTIRFDAGTGGSPFYGNFKDIKVYNTALTDTELQNLTS